MTTLKTFDSPTFSSLSNDSVLQVYLDISEPSLSSLPGYVFLSIIYPLFRSPHDNENVNGAFLAGPWALSIQQKVRGLPRFLQVWATLRAVVLSPRSVASDLEKPLLAGQFSAWFELFNQYYLTKKMTDGLWYNPNTTPLGKIMVNFGPPSYHRTKDL